MLLSFWRAVRAAALRDKTNDGCVIDKCASEDSRNNEASGGGGKHESAASVGELVETRGKTWSRCQARETWNVCEEPENINSVPTRANSGKQETAVKREKTW